jgi:ribosomal protein L24E
MIDYRTIKICFRCLKQINKQPLRHVNVCRTPRVLFFCSKGCRDIWIKIYQKNPKKAMRYYE